MRPLVAAFLLGLCGWATTGCTNVAASNVPIDEPKNYIVVLDASASRTPAVLTQDEDFLQQIVKRLSYSDRITLMNMQQAGLDDSTRLPSIVMPVRNDLAFQSTRDIERLKSKQNGVLHIVPVFFQQAGSGKALHTDIFSTMNLVGEKERDSPKTSNTLVLLSDMLQSAQGIEMDGALRMPPPNWIRQHQQMGTLPSLESTCVLVVGADDTNEAGAKVYAFWRQYFSAVGATLNRGNYRFTPPDESAPLCP